MIGSQITKLFDVGGNNKWYFGKVTSYDPATKYFKVRYTDGDEEELDEEEIHQHLAHRQHLASSDDDEEESSGREEEFDEEDMDCRTNEAITDEAPTATAPMPERGEMELEALSGATVTNTSKTPPSPAPEKSGESAADATTTAPLPSPSATGKRKRIKNTRPIEIKDHPKKDQLPGWKLRTDTNPILHISPDRKIPFRNFKIAKTFADLVASHGDEHAAFDIIEAEYRNKKRKNGRDLIYSVVSALPRDDGRSRHKSIQPKKSLDDDQVKVDDLPLESVEKILGKRSVGGRIEYLVHFANLSETEDAWVPKKKFDSKALRMANKFDKDAEVSKRKQGREGPDMNFLPSESVGAGTSPLMLNDEPVKVQVMADPGRIEKGCFLDEFAPGRALMRSYDISAGSRAKRYSPKAECQQNGGTYTATATRVVEQKNTGRSFGGPRKKDAIVYYILTKGGGLPEFNLQKELENLADFKSLPAHKIPARLEVRMGF